MIVRRILGNEKRLALTLIMLFIGSCFLPILGQSYEPGYIILKSNDTLHGMVRNRKDGMLLEKIKFKNIRDKTKRYSAEELLGYKAGIHTYEALWFAEDNALFKFNYYNRPDVCKKVFLKVMAKGALNCYAKEFIHDDNDYPDQFELFQRQGETTFERATQGIFGLKKKRLSHYFRDCPTLVEKINNRSLKTPLEVVAYYNMFCGVE